MKAPRPHPRGVTAPAEKAQLRYKNVPKVSETRADINSMIKETIAGNKTPAHSPFMEISAEDAFTPGIDLLKQKYEEKKHIIGGNVSVMSGEKDPRSFDMAFKKTKVAVRSTPGLMKKNGKYPENTDSIVVYQPDSRSSEIKGTFILGEGEGAEVSAVSNAAGVYAAEAMDTDIADGHLADIDAIGRKVSPIKKELGVENRIEGMSFGLDLNIYALKLAGNTNKVKCYIIDPKTGQMEQATDELNPVSQGDVVFMASDRLIQAINGEKGLQKVIKEGMHATESIRMISDSIMKALQLAQKEDMIEDITLSMVAFQVP